MLKRITAALLVLLLCLSWLPGRAEAAQTMEAFLGELSALTSRYDVDARILVRSEIPLEDPQAVQCLGWGSWYVIQYETAEQAQAAAKRYQAQGCAVDFDHVIEACSHGEEAQLFSWGYSQDYVNIQALQQRVLDQVGGDVSQLPEILVGVVDGGLDASNPIFQGRVVPGYDCVNYDDTTEDGTYHGTHVASTIAEGTLDNVKLMPIKVLGSNGLGYYADFAFGMQYAVEQGCRVVNLSIGDQCYFDDSHQLFVDIVRDGHEKGVVFCVAAGNFSSNADEYCPANVEGVITVAAHDILGGLAYNSNSGSCVDITAPGVGVLGAFRDGSMATMTGTSMATPHVTAVCALILSYDQTLTPEAVLQLIRDNAAPSRIQGGGAGLLCATGIFAEGDTSAETQEADTGWYFETEPEQQGWTLSEGWNLGTAGDVLIPQGNHGAVSGGSGQLISPLFTAGEGLSFYLCRLKYGAQAGSVTVSVSLDGGTAFEPIAEFAATSVIQRCYVDLSAYAGQQIQVAFCQQGQEEGAALVVDAVELQGGTMGDVTVTFLDSASGETLAAVQAPMGGRLTEALLPEAQYAFYGWDYDGTRLYTDRTVRLWYADPDVSHWDFGIDPLLCGWTTQDQDGNGHDWYYDGEKGAMGSDSFLNGSLNPDNWLISPDFTAGEQISFTLVARDFLLPDETVGFYLSTDGGETWSQELGYFTASDEPQTFAVDTSAFKGTPIRIAFRHYNNPMQSSVYVDDVQIIGDRTAPVSESARYGGFLAAGTLILAGIVLLVVKKRKNAG